MNLQDTPFIVETPAFILHFSSLVHLKRYERDIVSYRETVKSRLHSVYRVAIDSDMIADLALYFRVENRGCYIVKSGSNEVFRCPEEIKLDGLRLTKATLQKP